MDAGSTTADASDAGRDGPPAGGAGAQPDAAVRDGAADGAVGVQVLEVAGIWQGELQYFEFPSGSSAIQLELHVDPELGGEAVFGEGPARQAPDPNEVLDTVEDRSLRESYAYPLHDVVLEGNRLRFHVDTHDVWEGFCSSLPPIEDDDVAGSYRCIPGWPFMGMPTDEPGACYLTNPETGQNEELDCARFWFCGILGFCDCDATACHADRGFIVRFELMLSGPELRGPVAGGGIRDVEAVLERR
jgi:hypothetical protein